MGQYSLEYAASMLKFACLAVPSLVFADQQTITVFEMMMDTMKSRNTTGPGLRSNPIADGVMDQIGDYGCWCPKMLSLVQYAPRGGRPVDAIDRICKEWAKCRHCNKFSGCDGDVVDYTPTLTLDPVTITVGYQCLNMNECTTNVCQCDNEYALKLSILLVAMSSNGEQLDSSNIGDNLDAYCYAGQDTSNIADSCCGTAPTLQLFVSKKASCVAGQVESFY